MKRPYYRDPLAAAWMAKHFGMRFLDSNGKELVRDDVFLLFYQPDDPLDDEDEWDEKHFIHPDSMHLLDATGEDIAVLLADGRPMNVGPELADYITRGRDSWRIIQRNGVAFHWPESEAA